MTKILLFVLLMPMISFANFLEFRGKIYQCLEQITNYEVSSCMFANPTYLQLKTGTHIEISGLAKDEVNQENIKQLWGVDPNPGERTFNTPPLKVADSSRKFIFDFYINDRLKFNAMDEVITGCLPENTKELFFVKANTKYFLGSNWPYNLKLLQFKDGYAQIVQAPGSDDDLRTFTAPAPNSPNTTADLYLKIPRNWSVDDVLDQYCQDQGFSSGRTYEKPFHMLIKHNYSTYDVEHKHFLKRDLSIRKVVYFRENSRDRASCSLDDVKIKL